MIHALEMNFGLHIVEKVVACLEKGGNSIFARNVAGPVVLIVIGHTNVAKGDPALFGAEKSKNGVRLYISHPEQFIEVHKYLALREQHGFKVVRV